MKEVSADTYTERFNIIYDWFRNNLHAASEDEYTYQVIDLPRTHLKMVDIIRDPTQGVYFRVVLKAIYDDISSVKMLRKDYRDLNYLFETKTTPPITVITSTQVCLVQLDKNKMPVDGVLFTYSPHDESYHYFPLK